MELPQEETSDALCAALPVARASCIFQPCAKYAAYSRKPAEMRHHHWRSILKAEHSRPSSTAAISDLTMRERLRQTID